MRGVTIGGKESCRQSCLVGGSRARRGGGLWGAGQRGRLGGGGEPCGSRDASGGWAGLGCGQSLWGFTWSDLLFKSL